MVARLIKEKDPVTGEVIEKLRYLDGSAKC
jgi:hypothetical protein